MLDRSRVCAVCSVLLVALFASGCSEQSERLNSPPQGDSARPHPMQANFVYMTDNASLEDSAIADIHFEPHVADLNGLGVRKLTRLGELLSVTGGTVRYETACRDQSLINARLATVRQFLSDAGFNMNTITVEAGCARSTTTSANDAMKAVEKGSADDASAPDPAVVTTP